MIDLEKLKYYEQDHVNGLRRLRDEIRPFNTIDDAVCAVGNVVYDTRPIPQDLALTVRRLLVTLIYGPGE